MSRMPLSALLAATTLCGGAAQAQSPAAYAVTARIAAPDGGFDYTSFDPIHRRLYLARAGGVTAVDVDTKTVTPHLADAQRSHEVLPLALGTKLLITDSTSNSAHLVDALTGKLLAEIPTGQKPDAAIYDRASGLALVMNGKDGSVTLVDPVSQKATGTIAVGGGLEFGASDGAGKAYVNIEDQNKIAVLDPQAKTTVARYALPGCEGPTGLAYAPDAGVLIAACANKVAKVVRASDGLELATLTIGAGPDAVLYDAKRHLAFIPCGRDGVLEVIAVRSATDIAIVQTVKTQVGARTGAVDPDTGAVYLPAAKYGPAPAGGGRAAPIPGSFEILVVTPAAAQ